MSVQVSLEELPAAIDRQIGWCYLLTTNDSGLPRILAITPRHDAGASALVASVSPGTAASVRARPQMTLLYPPADAKAMSLIVDGDGAIVDAEGELVLRFRPTSAVLHRPAPPATPTGAP